MSDLHSDLNNDVSWKVGIWGLSPIIVFLGVYLVTSIVVGDFYKMPLSVSFLIASIWAAFTLRGLPLGERINAFSRGASSENVLYMIWIFILAGAFASMAKSTGAVDATVSISLKCLPPSMIVPGLFLATCFISMAIGTSVGTVVALTPLAVKMATSTGSEIQFFVAIVLGGAFFGDNLSFISDTTIAATRTQGCNMKDKFFANLRIVIPAAVMALCLYIFIGAGLDSVELIEASSYWLVLPYLLVIILAIIGINVVVVLILGILSALILALAIGMDIFDIFYLAGSGIDSVGDLIIVTLLASGMLGIIKTSGGIDFLLKIIGKKITTVYGAQGSIVALVGVINLCTANNTVAILTAGSLVRKISEHFAIPAKKAASLLDTGSCIVQSLIPYGAQTLMATSLAGISPVAPWRYLFYPQCLLICLIISIFIKKKRGR